MKLPKLETGNFCCFALQTRVSQDSTGVTQLGPGIFATTDKPFFIDQWWREQLGELEIRDIENCSLFLFAQTSYPEIDVPSLNSRLHSYYYSLLLQGVGYSRRGVLLGGENSSSGMRVTSIGWLAEYHHPWKVVYNEIMARHLTETTSLAEGIDIIFAQPRGDQYLRIRKGFNSFLSGVRYDENHNRLHQFVRSIDAIIKARQGKATKQFKDRGKFFAGSSADDVKLLTELYELRSAAEHLNPLDGKLECYQAHERNNIKALRTFQSELLSSFVYRKILSTPTLLSNFIDDAAIDLMWGQTASQLIPLWGSTIDLRTAPNGLFFDYL